MSDSKRESIIRDLHKLGVNIPALLAEDPTDEVLQDLRDGIIKLREWGKDAGIIKDD